MHVTPRERLRYIVQRYGKDLIHDARRCEALLRDLCGSYKKEIFALTSAVREGIPHELCSTARGVPLPSILRRHSKRLHDDVGISEELCEWSVEAWAYALGIVSQSDLRPETRCPSCDVRMQIPAKLRGRIARCPRCSAPLVVSLDGAPNLRPVPQQTSPKLSPKTLEPDIIEAEIVATPSESAEDVFRQVVWRVVATGGDLLAHTGYLERARSSLGLTQLAAQEIVHHAALAFEVGGRAAAAPPGVIASFVAPGGSKDRLHLPTVAYHVHRGRERTKPPAIALLVAGLLTVGWALLTFAYIASQDNYAMAEGTKTGLFIA